MKKTVLTLLSIFAIYCLNGQEVIESGVSEFASIKISGKLKVTLVEEESARFSLVLSNSESKYLEWKVNGDQLEIKLKQPMSIGSKDPAGTGEITIAYTSKFNKIICSSDAEIFCDNKFTSKSLAIESSSSSVVAMEVEVYSLDINASTNSMVSITGSSNIIATKATANCEVNTVAMECESATVTAGTAAEVYVTATKKLDLKAATKAKIYYKGTPEVFTEKVTTFGLIEGF